MKRPLAVVATVGAWALASMAVAASPVARRSLPRALLEREDFAALLRPLAGGARDATGGAAKAIDDAAAVSALAAAPQPGGPPQPGGEADAPSPGSPARAEWNTFYSRLAELERGTRGKVRVAHLGDSEIVGDGVSAALRRAFGARFGAGGPGFALAMPPVPYYVREGWRHQAGLDFQASSFVDGALPDGAYGPGGVSFKGFPGARAAVELQPKLEGPCSVALTFGKAPDAGTVGVAFDGGEATVLEARAAVHSLAVHRASFAACPSRLEIRASGAGPSRVFGWSVESEKHGVVWSSLGTAGARLAHFTNYDVTELAAALAALEPDLLVVAYGLNDTQELPPPNHAEELTVALGALRDATPSAACLVLGSYPVGRRTESGGVDPLGSIVLRVALAQKTAAEAEGCAFLDRVALSGGLDAPYAWSAARPHLISGDYRHLTVAGAEHMGNLIARSLLVGYDAARPAPDAAR